MYGIGGVVGSLVGGLATEYDRTDIVFYITAGVGFCIACTGVMMSRSLEANAESIINMTLKERIKLNFSEIKKGFKIREFHRATLFFVILGALVPSFTDYFYYYMMDITGITKFQYAMVSFFGYICMFLGVIIYSGYLKTTEVRVMMVISCMINLFGALSSLLFVRDFMFGLSPFIYVCFTSSATEVLYNAFMTLPSQVIFAKMIPSNIESSMFAITTGI